MVPATLKINVRVRKKNLRPDKAMQLLATSSRNRFVSVFHKLDGTECKIMIGFFDSSCTLDANIETQKVRMITKIRENQK